VRPSKKINIQLALVSVQKSWRRQGARRLPEDPRVGLDKGKRLTNTPFWMAGSVLKCPDDRKNRVVST
jgi:hypothetical protein